MAGQLSFFTADANPPTIADLEGLLVGLGQVVRMGGTARVSVVVTEQWRVEALLAAYRDRGLRAEQVPMSSGQASVRTAFSRHLLPVAERWTRGAMKAVPPRWSLDGARLRLWAVACGLADGHGYLLKLGPHDEAVWEPAGAALAALGVPGMFLGPRAEGPAYRIVGRRRLARLREYIADPPHGADDRGWPA